MDSYGNLTAMLTFFLSVWGPRGRSLPELCHETGAVESSRNVKFDNHSTA